MTAHHAQHIDPTVDEIETHQQIEKSQTTTRTHALKDHVSARLLEWGYISKGPTGDLILNASGRQLIRRQDN